MSDAVVTIYPEEIEIHPSYAAFYTCSVPGTEIVDIKSVLNYENTLYAVVVNKAADVMLWQTPLPLSDCGAIPWSLTPVAEGPAPCLELDFLCVLHEAAIWLIHVSNLIDAFVFHLDKSEWAQYKLSGPHFAKVSRVASFGSSSHGIYLANDVQHGILNTQSLCVSLYEVPPVTQMDDCFVIGEQIFGGDNGSLYQFSPEGRWSKILEAPKATFWSYKGNSIFCFIKAKQHGKPLQIGLSYNTETKQVQLLESDFVIPGETPFPYEIPSPIISHGPYFFFFTEELRIIYAFDVFTFSPYLPLHRQWRPLVNSPKFSDLTFRVSDRLFHAHKVLLSSYEYFAKLIDFPQPPDNSSPVMCITVDDVSPEAFGHLLHFLYCGTLPACNLDTSLTIELLTVGNKYLLQTLTYKCSELLSHCLDEYCLSELLLVLQAAHQVDEHGFLFKKAFETLLDHHPTFMAESEFISLSVHNLEFYSKILRIAMQFITVDKVKLTSKANCSLTLD